MNLHNEIMSLRCTVPAEYHGYKDPLYVYTCGFVHARQAAAELAIKACERIEDLEAALQWYVDTDEIAEGMEGNEFWVGGKRRAQALLKKVSK